jgi:hypothetical protein
VTSLTVPRLGGLDRRTRRRVEAIADRFEIPQGRPLTALEVVAQASQIARLPLTLVYTEQHSGLYSGSLLGTERGRPRFVALNRAILDSPLLQTLVAGHEVCHILLGHRLLDAPVRVALAPEHVPDLDPALFSRLMLQQTRCGGRGRDELACEMLGAKLVEGSFPQPEILPPGGPSGLPGLDASLGGGV